MFIACSILSNLADDAGHLGAFISPLTENGPLSELVLEMCLCALGVVNPTVLMSQIAPTLCDL